jgi:Concanavalin A-like lectin/glucanases superfamily
MRADKRAGVPHRASRPIAFGLTFGLAAIALTAAPAQADTPTIGAPTVTATADPPAGTVACPIAEGTDGPPLGSICSFTISPSSSDTAVPIGYTYNQVAGAPIKVTAAAPGNGNSFDPATGVATISVIIGSYDPTLYVSELTSGGTSGPTTTVSPFWGGQRQPADDGDFTNDGIPDLVFAPSVGSAVPAGLWLATGDSDGTVNPLGIDLGGSYPAPDGYKSTWDGTDAVAGNFCGDTTTDVLVYNPGPYNAATNADAGGGAVLCGDGSTDALDLGYNPERSILDVPSETFQDSNGNDATQLVDAGDTSGRGTGVSDVLATIGNQLVLFSTFAPGAYQSDSDFGSICSFGDCALLSDTPTPDGSFDWDSWTLATAQINGGTAMYLWNPTTGALDLWTGLTATDAANDGNFGNYNLLKYTQYTISAGGAKAKWNKGKSLELRASGTSDSTVPNLWTVDPATGKITTYGAALGANGVTLTAAGAAQTLITPAHSWVLNDRGSGSAETAQDGGSADTVVPSIYQVNDALPLTGNSGMTWNTGDQFSPDAAFDGATGYLTSNAAAVTPGTDFSVSAWVKPTAAGGTIFSQSGTDDSAFFLSPTAAGKWEFGLNTGGTTSATYVEKTVGSYVTGSWVHVTLVYTSATDTLALFVGSTHVGSVTTTTPPTVAGNFVLGADQSGGSPGSFFTGQIAHVTTWNSTLTSGQIAKLS